MDHEWSIRWLKSFHATLWMKTWSSNIASDTYFILEAAPIDFGGQDSDNCCFLVFAWKPHSCGALANRSLQTIQFVYIE